MQKNKTPFVSILIWGIVAVGLALLLSFFGAVGVSKGLVPEGMMGILASAIAAVSVFIAAVFALAGQGKTMRYQIAAGVGAVYLLFCVASKALFFRGSNENIWKILAACCIAVVAALCVSAMGQGRKRATVRRRR